ncbi:MAG: hypothetical protein ACK4TB_06560 [Gemmobacter sp.]
MTLERRLAKLEARRGGQGGEAIVVQLPDNLAARVAAAQATGGWHALSDADLRAVMDARIAALEGGRA